MLSTDDPGSAFAYCFGIMGAMALACLALKWWVIRREKRRKGHTDF